jgi:hypothetical protein
MNSIYSCCDQFVFHIKEREKIILYHPACRSYAIRVNKRIAQEIAFCPWCGSKLPVNLTNLRGQIVFDEFKLDSFDDPRLPKEFKTDEWWKKRGL